MKQKFNLAASLLASSLVLVSCDKGGGSFSVLSESSQFQQQTVFTPRKLDVLFLIDNSGSMQTSQNNLANNFPSFINRFIDKGYDFRLAVATSDAYRSATNAKFKSGTTPAIYVIDKADYNLSLQSEKDKLISDFSANVRVGVTGHGDERAFSSFQASLTSTDNANFHRPDAYLAVVIVSDEEDYSHADLNFIEPSTATNVDVSPLYTVASYKTFLEQFTNGLSTQDFSVSTISILDSACQTQLGAGRKIGYRYMALADMTGGTKNSLCAAFDATLDNISSSIASQTSAEFQLNKKPIVNSIRVLIDGVLVPESSTDGWSYNSTTNTIKINGATYRPGSGSNIVINFDPDLT